MYQYYEYLLERIEETPRKSQCLYTQARDEAVLMSLPRQTKNGARRRIASSLVQMGVRLDPKAGDSISA